MPDHDVSVWYPLPIQIKVTHDQAPPSVEWLGARIWTDSPRELHSKFVGHVNPLNTECSRS